MNPRVIAQELVVIYMIRLFSARGGPVVKTTQGKTRITIHLDNPVLGWFREQAHATGGAS